MWEVRNHYNVVCREDGEACRFSTFEDAKSTADRFYNECEHKVHYGVFKIEQVWTTSTLDEAIVKEI